MASAIVPLQNITLGSSQASVTFANIPNTFRDLKIVVTATANGNYNVPIYFNGTTTGYTSIYMEGNGSSVFGGNLTNYAGIVYGSNLSQSIIDVIDYASTKNKTFLSKLAVSTNAAGFTMGEWASTSTVTSVALTLPGTWSSGSTFALYGVSA